MARKHIGDTQVYFFSVDTRDKDAEKEISDVNGFFYIENVSAYVYSFKFAGINTQVIDDGHWNYLGNKYAGEYLADYFKENHIFENNVTNKN